MPNVKIFEIKNPDATMSISYKIDDENEPMVKISDDLESYFLSIGL